MVLATACAGVAFCGQAPAVTSTWDNGGGDQRWSNATNWNADGAVDVETERRGKNKATVAIARKVLTLVYYGLRDGEIRCLAKTA